MVIIAAKTTSEIVGTMYQQCFNGFQKFFKPWVPMFVKKLIQVPFSYKKPEPQLSKGPYFYYVSIFSTIF